MFNNVKEKSCYKIDVDRNDLNLMRYNLTKVYSLDKLKLYIKFKKTKMLILY